MIATRGQKQCQPKWKTLFARAMIGLDDDLSSSDDLRGWNAIVHLHRLPNREVLDAAISACSDVDPTKRRVGAAILGQLGHIKVGFEPVYTEERYNGLASLLSAERAGAANPAVLNDVCVALGHLRDQRAILAVLQLMNHHNADVRYGVVFGLLHHDTPEAIDGLIVLSSDPSEAVRDWATMGLCLSGTLAGECIERFAASRTSASHAPRHSRFTSFHGSQTMTDNQQQTATVLQQAIANLIACRNAGDPKALDLAEAHLAETMPGCIFDIFALTPLLADKTLSEETHDKIIANMIRATKFIEIEFDNVLAWFQLREASLAKYRNSYAIAVTSPTKAQEGIGSARSMLDTATGSNPVLAEAASELDATRALFEIADFQLNDPAFNELLAKNAAERRVFEEYLGARRQ